MIKTQRRQQDVIAVQNEVIAIMGNFIYQTLDQLNLVDVLAEAASTQADWPAKHALMAALGSIHDKANEALDTAAKVATR